LNIKLLSSRYLSLALKIPLSSHESDSKVSTINLCGLNKLFCFVV
jgi:hypothetical protein